MTSSTAAAICASCGHGPGAKGHLPGLGGVCYHGWDSRYPTVFPCSCPQRVSGAGSSGEPLDLDDMAQRYPERTPGIAYKVPELIAECRALRAENARYKSFCGEALCRDVERDRDALEAALDRVRALCAYWETDTHSSVVWPSEVLAAIYDTLDDYYKPGAAMGAALTGDDQAAGHAEHCCLSGHPNSPHHRLVEPCTARCTCGEGDR